ncbi:hypothetical protein [Thioalkalivibrio sp.]|uniref:hypothetical protein n=1 Tax=Thioalkalivibrio sp. TaxID=2093813 RepID=UPI0039763ABC
MSEPDAPCDRQQLYDEVWTDSVTVVAGILILMDELRAKEAEQRRRREAHERAEARARAGRAVEISSHRKVVARLVTASSGQEQGIDRLPARGLAQWDGSKPTGASVRLSSGGPLVSDLVQEDRG